MKTLLDIISNDPLDIKAEKEFIIFIKNNKGNFKLKPIFKKDDRYTIGYKLVAYGIYPAFGRNANRPIKLINF